MSAFPGGTESGPGDGGPDIGTGGESEPGGVPDILDPTSNTNQTIRHDWSRLLLALLLRIFPRTDIKTELADHGLKAESDTPEAVLESPEMRRLAVRPQQVPFAEADLNPGYLNPRRSLRVSR